MKDFLFVENWFYQKYRVKSDSRYWTFKVALNLFLQRKGKLIVETGCLRIKDDWGGGCSTLLLGEFCHCYGVKLITVDNNLENLQVAERETKEFENSIAYVHGDSLEFLDKLFGDFRLLDGVQKESQVESIDLLYLDSFDADPDNIRITYQAQRHQLAEMQLAFPKLSEKAIVLLDDNHLKWGGKCLLTKEFLLDNNFTLIMDFQQSLWVR